ncbi:unnamed protein product [Meganyctiphanes norvegica]|uniref:FAM69 protein-kinase domain-containing protein n=1 Tax=Meganyctiphanes norvegica TaxID=48144 RepID=A0AAV2QAW7_MEGNR
MKLSLLLPCCITRLFEENLKNRDKRKNCILWIGGLGCLFLIIVCALLKEMFPFSIGCSIKNIENHIKQLCSGVNEDELEVGIDEHKIFNLCLELCESSTSQDLSCHLFHSSKEAVFTLNRESKIIVKSISYQEEIQEEEDDIDNSTYYSDVNVSTLEDFEHWVAVYTKSFMNIGYYIDTKKILEENEIYRISKESSNRRQEFWDLIQDQEFLTSLLFQEFGLFPKILGYCKNFYAVEYFKPLTENVLKPYDLQWRERIYKALDIVHYVGLLNTVWSETLHLCDVKPDHFGWHLEAGHVVFLDMDAVLTESHLMKTMEYTVSCADDDDCSYFDCQGRCNRQTSKCYSKRVNTNLQVVCDKIFLGNADGYFNLYGLLDSHEVNDQLQDALELCRINKGMTTDVMIDVLYQASNRLSY